MRWLAVDLSFLLPCSACNNMILIGTPPITWSYLGYLHIRDCILRPKYFTPKKCWICGLFGSLEALWERLVRREGLEFQEMGSQTYVGMFSGTSCRLFDAFHWSGTCSLKLCCPVRFRRRFRLLGFVWDWILYIKSASDRHWAHVQRKRWVTVFKERRVEL